MWLGKTVEFADFGVQFCCMWLGKTVEFAVFGFQFCCMKQTEEQRNVDGASFDAGTRNCKIAVK